MTPWRRLLWATDFSEGAHAAGRMVLSVAARRARIDVATVIPADVGDLPPMLLSVLGDQGLHDAESALEDEVKASVLAALEEEAGFLFSAGRSPRLHVRAGDAAMEVCALARELGTDLLVMGPTGHRGMTELVFGSTLDHVTRRAPCPVLVMRPRGPAPEHVAR